MIKKEKTIKSKEGKYKNIIVAGLPAVNDPLYALSFFSGVGGLDKGARKAGFHSLLQADRWKVAGKAFELNINVHKINTTKSHLSSEGIFLAGEEAGDITKLSFRSIQKYIHTYLGKKIKKGEIDVIHGGPPCQDYSKCNNHRDVSGHRNRLIFQLLRIVKETKPKVVIIEQVPDLLSQTFSHIWTEIRVELNRMTEYRWGCQVMNAKNYGARQSRKRLIIMAVRRDLNAQVSFPLGQEPDLNKVSVNSLLPHIYHYSPGQYADGIKSAKGVFCTMTATGSEFVYDFDGKRRKPTIDERKVLTELEGLNLNGISQTDQKKLLGNMVQISFAEALFKHIRTEILMKAAQKVI